MQVFEKKAWEKRLRASVAAALLCCLSPCYGFAWLPDIGPASKVPVRFISPLIPPVSSTLPWAVDSQARLSTRPYTDKTTLLLVPPHENAGSAAFQKAYGNLDSSSKVAKTELAPLPQNPFLHSQLNTAFHKSAARKTFTSNVEDKPKYKLNSKSAKLSVLDIAFAKPKSDEAPSLAEMEKIKVKTYEVSEDHTVWRDEKEEQFALEHSREHIVLTPPSSKDRHALAPDVTAKTTLDKIEIASEQHRESAQPVVVTEKEVFSQLEPAAGGEPAVLIPPKIVSTTQPAMEPALAGQLVNPQPKLTPSGNEIVRKPVQGMPGVVMDPDSKITPMRELSDESKSILERLPAQPQEYYKPKKPLTLTRGGAAKEDSIKKHDAYGMKIAIKRPKMDVFRALESAYNALIAGDQQYAITQYKEVLDEDPENTLALFGLATTYQRAGQIKMARPLYAQLLEIDPHNVEGLNNFLVLLSDESPHEALAELEKLQHSHPGFSPVFAQMSLIFEKEGDFSKAAEQMARALAITPENLKYQYNMAIIYDRMGDMEEAAKWYRRLLVAQERGEKIPGNAQEVQQRLTFILSNTGSRH